MKKKILWICIVCTMLVGLTSCRQYIWFLSRATVWDTAEVYVLNFREGELTVELGVGEETQIVTVESFHEEYQHRRWGLSNRYSVWKPGQFPDSVYVEGWYLNPYDTSELDPVVIYRHTEGPESLTSIRILDGEALLFDSPFDGSQADEMGVMVSDVMWKGSRPLPIATVEKRGKTKLGYYDIPNLPINAGLMQIVEWERSSERVEAEDLFSDFCIRLNDLTNPKIYILVVEEAY